MELINILKSKTIDLKSFRDNFENLSLEDVITYEISHKGTYTIINEIRYNKYIIEDILIKFQKANLVRIDGIKNINEMINEFHYNLDDFNGSLSPYKGLVANLKKYIGQKYLKKIGLNNVGIELAFIYTMTKENSNYFKTYLFISGEKLYQVEFTFGCELNEEINIFNPIC